MKNLVMVLLIGYALSAGAADAATYYVAKNGSNGNSCAQAQSLATAKLTVAAGIGCLGGGGDTLLLRNGDYNEGITSSPSGTSWSNKVRIAAYPGDASVWLRPQTSTNGGGHVIFLDGNFHYLEFDGVNLDGSLSGTGGLWTSTNNGNDPHHIRFQNAEVIAGATGAGAAIDLGAHTKIGATGSNEVRNVVIHGGGLPGLCGYQCASYGVYIKGPNNLVENTDIYDTSGAGIQIYNADGDAADNNILRNNRIHDITRTGSLDEVWGIINVGSNNQIYNNLIYGIKIGNPANSGLAGIASSGNSNKIWNNTIYNKNNTGIVVQGSSTDVRNNIVYLVTGSPYVNNGSGTVQTNNLFGVDPLFVNGSANNFQLQAGSPAVNAGTNLSTVTTDFAGVSRPQGAAADIGAFEYSAQDTSPPTVTLPPAVPSGLRVVAN
ncbi:MAG: right-handed parallel beta-helix repeat-containing protein [Acidobacteriota bacterium]